LNLLETERDPTQFPVAERQSRFALSWPRMVTDVQRRGHRVATDRSTGIIPSRTCGHARRLHDGALSTLDALLCAAPRPTVTEPPMSAAGHDFGCTLSAVEKSDLLADPRR
jgi:hypothetical protein